MITNKRKCFYIDARQYSASCEEQNDLQDLIHSFLYAGHMQTRFECVTLRTRVQFYMLGYIYRIKICSKRKSLCACDLSGSPDDSRTIFFFKCVFYVSWKKSIILHLLYGQVGIGGNHNDKNQSTTIMKDNGEVVRQKLISLRIKINMKRLQLPLQSRNGVLQKVIQLPTQHSCLHLFLTRIIPMF